VPSEDGRDVAELTGRIVVLAGPGVIAAGALDGLRSFAAAGSLGVANTWGAKGVFNWDSPHHLGTCGLQARDFELLGWADADAIVAIGVDDDESPRDRYALTRVVDVAPEVLADAAGRVRAEGGPPRNELYPRLAAVAQPGFVEDRVPLHPARAVADLGAALPPGGLVAADPGIAGLWVARTFPTPALSAGEPRRVVVPSRRQPGAAAALALEATRSGRPAIAVTTTPLDDTTTSVFADAERERVPLVVAAWGEAGGSVRVVDDHRRLLTEALAAGGPTLLEVPVSLADTDLLIAAAGEVVAWGGLK
jgi:thiamine pyrophosphate-dependent acetolactate synthase large subunit-like protein